MSARHTEVVIDTVTDGKESVAIVVHYGDRQVFRASALIQSLRLHCRTEAARVDRFKAMIRAVFKNARQNPDDTSSSLLYTREEYDTQMEGWLLLCQAAYAPYVTPAA